MIEWLHPGLPFFVAAALLLLTDHLGLTATKQQITRKLLLILTPLAAIIITLGMSPGEFGTLEFLHYTLITAQVDKLSLVFVIVFCFMALIGSVYALHVNSSREHGAAYIYVGSALTVVLAGDYLTLFAGWELMAFASAYLVFARNTSQASAAGQRYLLVHISGGVCLLGGILLHYQQSGSLDINFLPMAGSLGFYLILTGFILNAAVPPLNAWLTDAYPEATITGAVFMCAFTTKTAIYVLIRVFPGTELLVWLGAIMAIYGVIYAVLENDCRRLLAYHIVSQVGYMVAAVGIGSQLALNGASAHAFAHILYKGLLFMGAGAVIYVTGRRKLTELGGLYKTMPITLGLYMVGALSISAFPLFSGFVSKSMVVAAAEQDHRELITLMLILASSGTFLHTGLKLPYYMFFGKPAPGAPVGKEPPANMLIAMAIAALACVAIGLFPGILYQLLPYPVQFEPYTASHITTSLSMLIFTALGFVIFLKHLDPEDTLSLDSDWFYRKGSDLFLRVANRPIARYEQWMDSVSLGFLDRVRGLSQMSLRLDQGVIDAAVNGIARLMRHIGDLLRRFQSGVISHYGLAMVLGLVLSLLLLGCVAQGGSATTDVHRDSNVREYRQ